MDNNKRVLLTADLDGAVGGINIWAKHLCDYSLGQSKITIDTAPDNRSDFTSFMSDKYHRIKDGIKVYCHYLFKVNKMLKEKDYDVFHITSSASYGLLRDFFLIKIAKHYNVSTILHYHFGRIPDLKRTGGWEWILLKMVSKMADKVIVLDQQSYSTLQKEGIKNIYKVPNPVAPSIYNYIEGMSKERLDNEVLFVGQCYKEKGIYELVEACEHIPNVKLKFVGSISESVKKSLLARYKGNSEIEFTGIKPYEEVIKCMLHCGVFVLPSYTEGFPNVILEAMACACPIVSTEVGAIPEMLDVENGGNIGLCVKPKEVKDLEMAISRMVNDRDYALQCGLNAQKRVKEVYSMDRIWKQMLEIW